MPIRMGGLGIRRASSLALPAFFSLCRKISTHPIAHPHSHSGPRRLYRGSYENPMAAEHRRNIDFPSTDGKQSSWDTPLLSVAMLEITSRSRDSYDWARFNAIQAPHASDWLFALPLAS